MRNHQSPKLFGFSKLTPWDVQSTGSLRGFCRCFLHIDGFVVGDAGFDQVDFGDLAALKTTITENTAGIVIEPVQGEGGIRPVPKGYLASIRALCDEHDILLMFDEVQSGVGRTGSLFAYQQLGLSLIHI